ncbi:hypothetical protein MTP99_002973 [Tenebrio molitor]|nr:hypothetical protein MTP99_002973 [Tenebrio molitor]
MKKKCCDQGLVVATQDNEDANNSGRNLTETINSLSTVVTDMKKVIEDLIRENKKLRQEIESMKSDKQQAKSADLDMNDMGVDEAMDRIRRANNVIIRGIPEAGGNIKLRYKLSRTLYHQLYLITRLRRKIVSASRIPPTITIQCSAFLYKTIHGSRSQRKDSGATL